MTHSLSSAQLVAVPDTMDEAVRIIAVQRQIIGGLISEWQPEQIGRLCPGDAIQFALMALESIHLDDLDQEHRRQRLHQVLGDLWGDVHASIHHAEVTL